MKQIDVVASTYRIRVGDATGTMFVMDLSDHQYFVTARHIAKKVTNNCEVEWERGWRSFPVTLVGHCKDNVDISVLSGEQGLPQRFLPEWKCPEPEPDLKLGEAVRFYGFPYGLSTSRGAGTVPVPLVKSGIVSGFYGETKLEPHSSFYIDGHNNPGFSGGPVISIRDGTYRVAGVISGYLPYEEEVMSIGSQTHKPIGRVAQNTGILLAWNIQHAIDVIVNNPIGGA